MSDESLARLSGSERAPLANVTPAGQLNPSERAELTLVLRRRAALPDDIVAGPTVLTSDELADRYGADPADVELAGQALSADRPCPALRPALCSARHSGPVAHPRTTSTRFRA